PGLGLCLFEQINTKFCDDILNVLEQQIIYEKLHGVYKKALNKALQNKSKSAQLINLLETFAKDCDDNYSDSTDVYYYEDGSSDKENSDPLVPSSDKENTDPLVPLLQNPKKRRGKGRPL